MIIDPIRARRMANKANARLRTKIMRKALAPFNRTASFMPENPAYAERVKLSEAEVKTIHDAIREVLYPEHHVVIKREPIGPGNVELANYMRDKIAQSAINSARAKRKVE